MLCQCYDSAIIKLSCCKKLRAMVQQSYDKASAISVTVLDKLKAKTMAVL